MSQSDSRKVVRKRWDQPAYRDGMVRAYLKSAEDALIKLLSGRHEPEHEHIAQAFSHVLAAEKIVQHRVETRP